MLYDVMIWNGYGYATDMVTGSRRRAVERYIEIVRRGQWGYVSDYYGNTLAGTV